MRKLDTLVEDFLDTYSLMKQDEVSKTYAFSKSYVSYRKPRAVSPEQRERAKQMMIKRNKAKVKKNQSVFNRILCFFVVKYSY